MPAGSKPGEHRGGRQKGSKNRKTLEREARARMLNDSAAAEAHVAAQAERERAAKRPTAKDVLANFMHVFAGMAAARQPAPPGQPINPNASPTEFLTYSKLALDAATKLAPYQSATLRPLMADEDRVQDEEKKLEVIIKGGLPEQKLVPVAKTDQPVDATNVIPLPSKGAA